MEFCPLHAGRVNTVASRITGIYVQRVGYNFHNQIDLFLAPSPDKQVLAHDVQRP